MLLVGRRAIAAPSGGMASAGLSMLTRATTKRHIVSQLDFMLRLLKVVLALGIPTIVVLVLIHSGLRNMSTASLAEWFTGYLIAIAAPQLVLTWVGTIRSFHTWAVVGALVALDTWLIFSRGRFSIRRITLEPVGLSIWSGHCRSQPPERSSARRHQV
jgi:hypothetical protein